MLAVVKAHGERLLSAEIGRHKAGIHPAGQEAAHLHIADAVRRHRVGERPVNLVHRLLQRHAFVRVEGRLPVAGDLHLPVGIGEIMRRGQAINILEKGFSGHGILEGQIAVQRRRVQLLFHVRVGENGFDLRAEYQPPVRQPGVVHGLDAEIVPGEEQPPLRDAPDGEAEHPPQPGQQIGAPFLIAVEQGLAVAVGGKGMSQRLQLLP